MVPVPRGLNLNQDRNLSPGKVRLGELSTTPNLDEPGLSFLWSLGRAEVVQAPGYSSTPDISVLLILWKRNYWDLYQSCRRVCFSAKNWTQVESHCSSFAFPIRAGEVQRELQRFRRWTQKGPGGVLGKRAFHSIKKHTSPLCAQLLAQAFLTGLPSAQNPAFKNLPLRAMWTRISPVHTNKLYISAPTTCMGKRAPSWDCAAIKRILPYVNKK